MNCAELFRDTFFKLTGEMSYRIKLRGQSSAGQRSPTVKVLLIAFIGASLAGASLGLLAESSQQALIMGSFGASIFLVMAVPDLPFAQPRNVLAGHFLASAIGLACFHFIGEGFFIMGLALGLTTVAMLFLRSRIHLPAPIQLQFSWQDQTGVFLLHRHWPVRSLSWRWVSPIIMYG